MSSKLPGESSKKKSKRRRHRESGFEEWGGYMPAKKRKLELQFEEQKALELMQQKETKIFNGIAIFVNGYTKPPADELKRLMLVHGGKYHHYPSSKTTHVIASNLPKSKMKLLKTLIIVTADWITDSIKAGKLLPYQNYLLYTPEVADKQQRLQVGNYFKKQSTSPSNAENHAIKEGNSPKKRMENTSMLEELFGEELDSDSSIDSEQNSQCSFPNKNSPHRTLSDQKVGKSNHGKVSSRVKPSLNVDISASAESRSISHKDSLNWNSSSKTSENHNFIEKNKNKLTDELFGKDLDSDSSVNSEKNFNNSSSNKVSPPLKSSSHHSYQKHATHSHRKVSSPSKSSSNVDISASPFSKNRSKASPIKSSSAHNQNISSKDSSHLRPSLNENILPNNSSLKSEQNIKSNTVSKNSPHKTSTSSVSYQKHGASNNCKVPSPIKSCSNANISASNQNQSTTNSDSSHSKSSPNNKVSHSSGSQSTSHKDSSYSKSSPNSVSHSSGSQSTLNKDSSHSKSSPNNNVSHSSGSQLNKDSSYSKSSPNNVSHSSGSQLNKDSSHSKPSPNNNVSHSSGSQSTSNKDSSYSKSSPNKVFHSSGSQSTSNRDSSYSKSSPNNVSHSSGSQSTLNKDSSYSKSSPNNVSHSSGSQSTSNKDSSYSKSLKNMDASISPQKHNKAVKAGDPNFLPEFFNHSRKHHISTSAQELKRYVQFLVESNKKKHFPKRERLRELAKQFPNDSSFITTSDRKTKGKARVIMHLDMDCFFVSVGLRKHPELRGLPVAVTHSKGKKGGPQEGSDIGYEASHYTNESKKKLKGVMGGNEAPKVSIYSKEYGSLSEVACCSYEAREAGVRNGLFLGEALRRCPNLQTIPYDFEGYSEVSKKLYDIVASYTLDIEAVSCDELYIDCTELLQDVGLSPHQFASILRAEIENETGCTASAGMGSNMLLARLSTKVAKPNGQHFVYEAEIENFMKHQKVEDLPGVGYSTKEKLHALNVRTCGDLLSWSLSKLQQEFGPKTGQVFYNNCRGKDDRLVQYYKDRKSVSAEINYGIRFETEEDVYNFINELSKEVENRIQNLNCKGKLLTLKLMVRKSDAPIETAKFMGHGVCDNFSKSVALKSATDSSQVISKECCAIARSLKIKPQDYRGVGIQLSKLEPVQKSSKTGANIFKQSPKESTAETDTSYGVFAAKNIDKVNKAIPEKSTIKHFLSNKSSPSKHLDSSVENKSLKDVSPLKPSEPPSKHGQKSKTIEHFLSSKPSTSRTRCYNVADYLPEEIDESVLEALPEDLKREILQSCKTKSVEKERKSLNQNASTSEREESAKSLCQEQKNEELNVRMDSNSVQSEVHELDQSFLNALPEDLRKEVMESYDNILSKQQENSTSAPSAQQPSTSFASKPNTPVKVKPKKTNSSHIRAGNSNLGKNSPVQLDESVLNALPEDLKKEVLESYNGHPFNKAQKPPRPPSSNQVSPAKEHALTDQKSSKTTSEIDSPDQAEKKRPTLGGAFELDDVRTLIKEWIDSTDEPLEEDVNDLKSFLVELCDVQLTKVEILSKYLYRMAKKANEKWKDVYLTVLSSVQEKVMSIYHCTLILNDEFPT